MMVRIAAALVLVVAGAACSGDDADEATPTSSGESTPEATSPTSAPPTTAEVDAAEPGTVAGGQVLDGQCRAAVVELLRAVEPFVEGREAADLLGDDLDADGLAAASAGPEARVEAECPAIDDREAYAAMIELARREAPGTVWYLELVDRAASGR